MKLALPFLIAATLGGAAVAADGPPPPPAPPTETVFFNGHAMALSVHGDHGDEIEIRYVDAPSDLLLAGRWTGRALFATAYVTVGSCGTFPFAVIGGVDAYGNLVVRGRVPRINMALCLQLGTEWTRESRLIFTHQTETPSK